MCYELGTSLMGLLNSHRVQFIAKLSLRMFHTVDTEQLLIRESIEWGFNNLLN